MSSNATFLLSVVKDTLIILVNEWNGKYKELFLESAKLNEIEENYAD